MHLVMANNERGRLGALVWTFRGCIGLRLAPNDASLLPNKSYETSLITRGCYGECNGSSSRTNSYMEATILKQNGVYHVQQRFLNMVRLLSALNHASELCSLVIVLVRVVLRAKGGLLVPCQMLVAF